MITRNSSKIFSLFLLLILTENIISIKIPIKLVKSSFQKGIPKTKHLMNNNDNKLSYIASQKVYTDSDYLFLVDMQFGSNSKSLTVILDTGSEILWVPGYNVNNNGKYYNPSESTTSKKTTERMNYEYSAGTVSGTFYNDQINFILSNNFYFTFGVASQISLSSHNFDGVLGLGRKYKVSDSKYSILQIIKNNGAIKSTKFSFKYDYKTKNLDLYLGEEHEDFSKKNVASCPLTDGDTYGESLWTCDLYSFSVMKENNVLKKISIDYEALFDTGTNHNIFPSEILDDLRSTFLSFNCYIQNERDSSSEYMKAVYCRDPNNLPKISFGLKSYILTLGKENFYNRIYINNEYIYRLRLLFVDEIDFCVIGQNFFFEYHILFDNDKGVLKFYNDEEDSITYHEEEEEGIKTWLLILLIVGGVLILAGITFIIIYCCCCKKREYLLLDKELLELSSIKKSEDKIEDTADTSFNHIMSITSSKRPIFNKSN